MAKDLVRTRNYVTRFIEMKTHLNAVSLKMQVKTKFIKLVSISYEGIFLSQDHKISRCNGSSNERSHKSTDEAQQ